MLYVNIYASHADVVITDERVIAYAATLIMAPEFTLPPPSFQSNSVRQGATSQQQ